MSCTITQNAISIQLYLLLVLIIFSTSQHSQLREGNGMLYARALITSPSCNTDLAIQGQELFIGNALGGSGNSFAAGPGCRLHAGGPLPSSVDGTGSAVLFPLKQMGGNGLPITIDIKDSVVANTQLVIFGSLGNELLNASASAPYKYLFSTLTVSIDRTTFSYTQDGQRWTWGILITGVLPFKTNITIHQRVEIRANLTTTRFTFLELDGVQLTNFSTLKVSPGLVNIEVTGATSFRYDYHYLAVGLVGIDNCRYNYESNASVADYGNSSSKGSFANVNRVLIDGTSALHIDSSRLTIFGGRNPLEREDLPFTLVILYINATVVNVAGTILISNTSLSAEIEALHPSRPNDLSQLMPYTTSDAVLVSSSILEMKQNQSGLLIPSAFLIPNNSTQGSIGILRGYPCLVVSSVSVISRNLSTMNGIAFTTQRSPSDALQLLCEGCLIEVTNSSFRPFLSVYNFSSYFTFVLFHSLQIAELKNGGVVVAHHNTMDGYASIITRVQVSNSFSWMALLLIIRSNISLTMSFSTTSEIDPDSLHETYQDNKRSVSGIYIEDNYMQFSSSGSIDGSRVCFFFSTGGSTSIAPADTASGGGVVAVTRNKFNITLVGSGSQGFGQLAMIGIRQSLITLEGPRSRITLAHNLCVNCRFDSIQNGFAFFVIEQTSAGYFRNGAVTTITNNSVGAAFAQGPALCNSSAAFHSVFDSTFLCESSTVIVTNNRLFVDLRCYQIIAAGVASLIVRTPNYYITNGTSNLTFQGNELVVASNSITQNSFVHMLSLVSTVAYFNGHTILLIEDNILAISCTLALARYSIAVLGSLAVGPAVQLYISDYTQLMLRKNIITSQPQRIVTDLPFTVPLSVTPVASANIFEVAFGLIIFTSPAPMIRIDLQQNIFVVNQTPAQNAGRPSLFYVSAAPTLPNVAANSRIYTCSNTRFASADDYVLKVNEVSGYYDVNPSTYQPFVRKQLGRECVSFTTTLQESMSESVEVSSSVIVSRSAVVSATRPTLEMSVTKSESEKVPRSVTQGRSLTHFPSPTLTVQATVTATKLISRSGSISASRTLTISLSATMTIPKTKASPTISGLITTTSTMSKHSSSNSDTRTATVTASATQSVTRSRPTASISVPSGCPSTCNNMTYEGVGVGGRGSNDTDQWEALSGELEAEAATGTSARRPCVAPTSASLLATNLGVTFSKWNTAVDAKDGTTAVALTTEAHVVIAWPNPSRIINVRLVRSVAQDGTSAAVSGQDALTLPNASSTSDGDGAGEVQAVTLLGYDLDDTLTRARLRLSMKYASIDSAALDTVFVRLGIRFWCPPSGGGEPIEFPLTFILLPPPKPALVLTSPVQTSIAVVSAAGVLSSSAAAEMQTLAVLGMVSCSKGAARMEDEMAIRALSPAALTNTCRGAIEGNFLLFFGLLGLQSMATVIVWFRVRNSAEVARKSLELSMLYAGSKREGSSTKGDVSGIDDDLLSEELADLDILDDTSGTPNQTQVPPTDSHYRNAVAWLQAADTCRFPTLFLLVANFLKKGLFVCGIEVLRSATFLEGAAAGTGSPLDASRKVGEGPTITDNSQLAVGSMALAILGVLFCMTAAISFVLATRAFYPKRYSTTGKVAARLVWLLLPTGADDNAIPGSRAFSNVVSKYRVPNRRAFLLGWTPFLATIPLGLGIGDSCMPLYGLSVAIYIANAAFILIWKPYRTRFTNYFSPLSLLLSALLVGVYASVLGSPYNVPPLATSALNGLAMAQTALSVIGLGHQFFIKVMLTAYSSRWISPSPSDLSCSFEVIGWPYPPDMRGHSNYRWKNNKSGANDAVVFDSNVIATMLAEIEEHRRIVAEAPVATVVEEEMVLGDPLLPSVAMRDSSDPNTKLL